jgi:hypothetical protein
MRLKSIDDRFFGRSRIALGIRLLRRHSQTKSASPRSSSARRRAIADAHAPWAYFPYSAGPSTLGPMQLRRDAEMRGGEGQPFTLAIFTATTDERSKPHDLITGKSFDQQLR